MSSRRYKGSVQEAMAAEDARVAALIARTKADRERELDRKAAEFQVASGQTVNIGEAVIEPTPEWLSQGESRTFTPRLEDGTVRTVKAYRRVTTPTIVRLYMDGKIAERIYHACVIYRRKFDEAGLTGRYKTSHLSLAGNVGGGTGGMAQHPMAKHGTEAEARDLYRQARRIINPRFLPVFEYVVVEDFSLRAATVKAKRDNSRILANFRYAGERLAEFWEGVGIELAEDVSDAD